LLAPTLTLSGVGAASVTFSWTASPNATAYQLMRKTGIQGGFVPVSAATADLTATDSTPAVGATYVYEVVASNALGSTVSNLVVFTMPEPVPQGLTATAHSTTEIDLAWTSLGAQATSYIVQQSADGGVYSQLDPPATTNSYLAGGLAPGTRYSFEVAAVKGLNTSDFSSPASATTPLDQVTNLAFAGGALSWSAVAGAQKYLVSRYNGQSFVPLASVAALTYTDSTAVAGSTYEYEIEATTPATSGPPATITVTY
jgi:hypothetical protein